MGNVPEINWDIAYTLLSLKWKDPFPLFPYTPLPYLIIFHSLATSFCSPTLSNPVFPFLKTQGVWTNS